LIASLAAVVLALMLLGAFFISNRSFLSMSRHSDDQVACHDALMALSDYCRFRFEKDKGWLVIVDPDAPAYQVKDELGREVMSLDDLTQGQYDTLGRPGGLQGSSYVVGSFPSNGVQLRLAVSNYFEGTEATSSDGVARKCCRLRIEAARGTATERVELLLRKAPLFDSTVFASEKVRILADRVAFNSADPIRNQIRSLSSVELPHQDKMAFREDQAEPPAIRGTVWAQDPATNPDPDDEQGAILVDGDHSGARLKLAAEKTKAQFMPDDPGRYTPPEIKKEDLTGSGDPDQELAPATYCVSEATISYLGDEGQEYATVKMLQRFDSADPVQPPAAALPPTDFYFMDSEVPHDADPASIKLVLDASTYGGDPPFEPTPHRQSADGFQIARGPHVDLRVPPPVPAGSPVPPWEPLLTFDAEQKLGVTPDPMNSTPPDFKVLAGQGGIPEIAFLKEDGSPGKGIINADRDITLQGKITGSLQLISGGDINLIPNDVEALADVDGDVALYATGNVTIEPLQSSNGSLLNRDGYFTFRGLVYAGGSFEFSSTAGSGSAASIYHRKLDIRGALVANHGQVYIQGNEKTTITYDPDYLDKFLEKNATDSTLQVEEVSWRPI
jgi:hypothetical protein